MQRDQVAYEVWKDELAIPCPARLCSADVGEFCSMGTSFIHLERTAAVIDAYRRKTQHPNQLQLPGLQA